MKKRKVFKDFKDQFFVVESGQVFLGESNGSNIKIVFILNLNPVLKGKFQNQTLKQRISGNFSFTSSSQKFQKQIIYLYKQTANKNCRNSIGYKYKKVKDKFELNSNIYCLFIFIYNMMSFLFYNTCMFIISYHFAHPLHYINQMTQRQSRAKRSSFIINVIETPHGFSIVEGTELLNKPEGNAGQPPPPVSTITNPQFQPPAKEYRPVFKKTNLVFLKRPFAADADTAQEESLTTPEFCRVYAQWFDLNRVHSSQRREVVEWFCDKFGCSAEEAEEREELAVWIKNYRKDRNFIVKLYESEFAQAQKYLSASCIRKYLCCDSFWVMKIHQFLGSLGAINANSPSSALEANSRAHIMRVRPDGKKELLPFELSTKIRRPASSDQGELLKKLTAELRPYCDFCRIHCGLVWFQHTRSLDPKEIANIMKNVNSKNPPLSQKEYEYVLCVRCYCENNFPLLLTHHDFKKVTVNDKLDPARKKRSKRRRREKRRKEGEQQGEEAAERQQQNEEKTPLEDEEEGDRKRQQINATITKLVQEHQEKEWTLQQTDYLLQLVAKYGENWTAIHDDLKRKGFCRDLQTEHVILYFLSLPRRGVIRLEQEYEDEQFVEANFSSSRIGVQDRLAERKLNDAIQFASQAGPKVIAELTKIASEREYPWRTRIDEMVRLQIQKYNNRVEHLQACQSLVRSLRVFDECKRL